MTLTIEIKTKEIDKRLSHLTNSKYILISFRRITQLIINQSNIIRL